MNVRKSQKWLLWILFYLSKNTVGKGRQSTVLGGFHWQCNILVHLDNSGNQHFFFQRNLYKGKCFIGVCTVTTNIYSIINYIYQQEKWILVKQILFYHGAINNEKKWSLKDTRNTPLKNICLLTLAYSKSRNCLGSEATWCIKKVIEFQVQRRVLVSTPLLLIL